MQHRFNLLPSRRAFIRGGIGLAAGALISCAKEKNPVKQALPRESQVFERFPDGFQWGVATAAYQIEGAVKDDGREPSIWDTFCHTPGKIVNDDTGDVACDHYHRFAEDVALMAELGVKHYRFSISWARIMPDGRGTVNEKGVDFYRHLADTLGRHGITPHATLYHWDLPQALQERYAGWQNREVVNDFGEYANQTVKRLGSQITDWITLNEISTFCYYNGYTLGRPGHHAPGVALTNPKEHAQLLHHALLAHGVGCQAIRAASPVACRVAVAENYRSFVPVIETSANIAATKRAFAEDYINGAVILPLLTGRYDEKWITKYSDRVPHLVDGDLKIIGQPLDALGFNCYTGEYVQALDNSDGYEVIPFSKNYPKGNMGWLNIVPEAAYWGIRIVGELAGGGRLPIFVSENGYADGSEPNAAGIVYDTDRIMYCRAYLRQIQRAVSEGHPVSGYFHWSLIDNFEWAFGFSKKFGLVRVDFKNQRRIPKLSYHWYQQVTRENRVV